MGGNSKVYGAALLRLLPGDFGEIRHPNGVAPAWPVSYDDIAGVVSFLAGPTGRWVNGQVVYANGGFV